MTRLVLFALIGLTACEEPQLIATRDLGRIETSLSCNKMGYCMTCMPGFDGKSTCALKFSAFCPGQRPATALAVEQTLRYPSKPAERFTRIVTSDEEPTGSCT